MNMILNRFYENLKNYPQKNIIITDTKIFTNKDIDKISNAIAKQCSLSMCEYVPYYIKNDYYVLPVILAIWKVNKIPLPLANDLNIEDHLNLHNDIKFDVIITDQSIEFNSIEVQYAEKLIDDNLGCEWTPTSKNAYIVTTSGSTGKPKKIILTFEGIFSILMEYYHIIEADSDSRFLFSTSYTFDVSLGEILAPILLNASLYCFSEKIDNSIKKINNTVKYIKEKEITHLLFSPSYADFIISNSQKETWETVKSVTMIGEKFPISLKEKFIRKDITDLNVFNMYGPAETTLFATFYKLNFKEEIDIPLGNPFKGVEIQLKKYTRETKEVFISGIGLSEGYTNKNLNENRFVLQGGQYWYKTGDYIIEKDGNLIYGGRIDNQIKINGVRVELDGIDNLVSSSRLVEKVKSINEKNKIFSFVVAKDTSIDEINEFYKKHFSSNLNIQIKFLEEMPINRNGKVDTQKLKKLMRPVIKRESNEDIKGTLSDILRKQFDAYEIKELDSLDLLRFYLKVEDKFNIVIKEEYFLEMKNMNKLVDYIQTDNYPVQKDIALSLLNEKNDLSNIKSIFESMKYNSGTLSETLYLQKNYQIKQYFSCLYFDIKINTDEIEEFKKALEIFTEQMDITKIFLIHNDGTILFEFIENYIPILYHSNHFLNEHKLAELMFTMKKSPQFLINLNTTENIARFYFSHNIIDKKSINMAANIFGEIYYYKNDVFKYSSYREFISFIRNKNKNITGVLPDTIHTLNHNYSDPSYIQYLICDMSCSNYNSRDYSKLTAYLTAKSIMRIDKYETITGSIVMNIRKFKGFNAENLIGDIHSNYPFYLNRTHSYSDFENIENEYYDLYSQGFSFREYIYNTYPEFSNFQLELLEKWKQFNLSVNYIGEVKSVENTIKELLKGKYNEKYTISFTYDKKLYIYLPGKFFSDQIKFNIDGIDIEIKNEVY